MSKFILVATSSAKEGRDREYNEWYDAVHINELLDIPGIVSARRFAASPSSPHVPPSSYLAIYEIEAEDPAVVMRELMSRGASGQLSRTDSLDPSSGKLWLWAQNG